MKKLLLSLIIVASVFLMGCVTSQDNQSQGIEGYKPQVNMFEDKGWITISDLELFQDKTSLYLYISYASKSAGKYSMFNPPSGNAFKFLGDLADGTGTILRSIEKDSLNGVEGITVFLFPGDYSNESKRVGFFINSEEINWGKIPSKPSELVAEVVVVSEEENKSAVIVPGSSESGSSPDNAISFAEYVFPEDFLSNMTEYYLDEKIYKWKGRYFKVQFLISEKVESFQKFIDSADLDKEYSIEDLIGIFGQPLFYMAGMDYILSDSDLPDRYSMVYTSSWSDDPTASLTIDIENGKPTVIETKYYGWFDINGISVGQQFSEIEDMINVQGTLSREDAYARTQTDGEHSIDKYIIDSGMFASYSDFSKSFEVTWEKDSGTGIFIMHILLNQDH